MYGPREFLGALQYLPQRHDAIELPYLLEISGRLLNELNETYMITMCSVGYTRNISLDPYPNNPTSYANIPISLSPMQYTYVIVYPHIRHQAVSSVT